MPLFPTDNWKKKVNLHSRGRFWSYVLWVMSPPRYPLRHPAARAMPCVCVSMSTTSNKKCASVVTEHSDCVLAAITEHQSKVNRGGETTQHEMTRAHAYICMLPLAPSIKMINPIAIDCWLCGTHVCVCVCVWPLQVLESVAPHSITTHWDKPTIAVCVLLGWYGKCWWVQRTYLNNQRLLLGVVVCCHAPAAKKREIESAVSLSLFSLWRF